MSYPECLEPCSSSVSCVSCVTSFLAKLPSSSALIVILHSLHDMYHVRIRICYNKYQLPQMRRRLQPLQTWPPRGCALAVPMQTPHSIAPSSGASAHCLTLLVLDKPKSHHGIFSTMPVTRRKSSRK